MNAKAIEKTSLFTPINKRTVMKKISLFAIMMVLTLSVKAQKEVIDKIVGKVGNELILLSDIEEQHDLMEKERGSAPEDLRCSLMDNQLASKLLLTHARLDSVEVTQEEVEAQLNARIDQILAYMNNDLNQFREYYGQGVSEVKEQFRQDLENQLLVQRMRGTIVSDIAVTPSEVREFFASIPKDSLPYFSSEVEVGEVVMKPEVNKEQKELAKSRIDDIRNRVLEGGEDFAELAKIFSDDPGSARIGGDLGWQRRGTFVPEFEAAAYNLDKGEYSKIVESDFGFHFIQTIERRGNSIHTRHILIRPEITEADLELTASKLDTIRNLLATDSISFNYAVKRYSDDKVQSYNNGGSMVNEKTGNTFFEGGDLEPEIFFTIDTMEVNDISAPIQYRDPSGEIYYRIILLKSRTPPHKANLASDYSKIKAAALESKTNVHISKWVQEKVAGTYIYIDGIYHGCPVLKPWLEPKMLVKP